MKEDFTKALISAWQKATAKEKSGASVFLKRFSRHLPAQKVLGKVHEEVFEDFDCLQCAGCCKNSSPVFTRTDVNRIAAFIRLSPGEMEMRYLKADAEGDFVPLSKPCPFLLENNYCSVYELRPKSCRGFPHTDQPAAWQRHSVMAGNARACPAAWAIVTKFQKGEL